MFENRERPSLTENHLDYLEMAAVGTTRFLTTSEVAELLQLNVETVYSLISKQNLPAVKIGGQWRFGESDLFAWISQHAVGRTEESESNEQPVRK